MEILENVLTKTKAIMNVVGEKVNEFVDVSKTNIKISELKSELKSEYEKLGKLMYESRKNNIEEINSEINKFVSKIDLIYNKMEKLKTKIAMSKNKTICKSCNSLNEDKAIYCKSCGKKLDTDIDNEKNLEVANSDKKGKELDSCQCEQCDCSKEASYTDNDNN